MVSRKISLGHKTDERCLPERWKSTHKFSKVNALKKRKEGKFLFSTGRTKTLIFNLYLCLQNCTALSAEKLHLREQMEGITTSYSQCDFWVVGNLGNNPLLHGWLCSPSEVLKSYLSCGKSWALLWYYSLLVTRSGMSTFTCPLFLQRFLLWMLLSTLSGSSIGLYELPLCWLPLNLWPLCSTQVFLLFSRPGTEALHHCQLPVVVLHPPRPGAARAFHHGARGNTLVTHGLENAALSSTATWGSAIASPLTFHIQSSLLYIGEHCLLLEPHLDLQE